MTAASGEDFVADSGSPFALALTAARAAAERQDQAAMDGHYRRAVRLARGLSARLPGALAVDHIISLRAMGNSTMALAQCEKYLAAQGKDPRLLLVRAETKLTLDDHTGIDTELAEIRRITDGRPLDRAGKALLARLCGLAEGHHERFESARQHLYRSREGYADLGDTRSVAVLDDDLRALATHQGLPIEKPAANPGSSPEAQLTRSEELRMAGRYETALDVVTQALTGPVDPAKRFYFLEARVRLLRLLRDDDQADAALPELHEAARQTARPGENLRAAQRLAHHGTLGPAVSATGGSRLLTARWLIKEDQLAEAEQLLLGEADPEVPSDRHSAEWNLAAAELMMAIARWLKDEEDTGAGARVIRQAVAHSEECLRHAAADSLIVLRVAARRLLGHAHAELGTEDSLALAVQEWAKAHRLEESVTALQPTDGVRLRMLHAVPTEFDQWIQWAANRKDEQVPRADALVVVAMEAARGAAILPHLLPGQPRALPAPGDVSAAHRWLRRAVRGLPRSQVVWLLHATGDTVHHAFLERSPWGVRIRYEGLSFENGENRDGLVEAVGELAECWKNGGARTLAMAAPGRTTQFDGLLARVTNLLGIHRLQPLPGRIRRIAVVAGGELAEIPFALLPCPGPGETLIGRRYALSSLPSLATWTPLRRRARTQRGVSRKRMLVLHGPPRPEDPSGPESPITPARTVRNRKLLPTPDATPAALRTALGTGRFRQVRIDSHGSYGGDPANATLFLTPWGDRGRLSPDEFQAMHFGATGTLVLGACETGMFRRVGRDEHTGFVRAALASGASSVLAARWEALDDVAADIVDRFERNLRRYPRDVALFRAQRAADIPGDHPTRWAAWTLHGATGYQARFGPLRRLFHFPSVNVGDRRPRDLEETSCARPS